LNNIPFLIKNIIIHSLQNDSEESMLSNDIIEINLGIRNFIEKCVDELFEDPLLKEIESENEVLKNFENVINERSFIYESRKFAEILQNIIVQNPNIPSGHLICLYGNIGDDETIVFLKAGFKKGFDSKVLIKESVGQVIVVEEKKCLLPSSVSQIDEAVIFNISKKQLLIKAKKYLIDGKRISYLEECIFENKPVLSSKEKVNIIEKTRKEIVKKHFNGDLEKSAVAKQAVVDSVVNNGVIDVSEVVENSFKENPNIQKIYKEKLEERGVIEKEIEVPIKIEKKLFKKQKMVTDNDIEIYVPLNYINSPEIIEFKVGENGKLNIILKGIEDVKEK